MILQKVLSQLVIPILTNWRFLIKRQQTNVTIVLLNLQNNKVSRISRSVIVTYHTYLNMSKLRCNIMYLNVTYFSDIFNDSILYRQKLLTFFELMSRKKLVKSLFCHTITSLWQVTDKNGKICVGKFDVREYCVFSIQVCSLTDQNLPCFYRHRTVTFLHPLGLLA